MDASASSYKRSLQAVQELLRAGLLRAGRPAFASIGEFDAFMQRRGFHLSANDPFGPAGADARQIIYRGIENVIVKVKTRGYAGGPRMGRATMSVEVCDGRGIGWDNALFKVDADGKVIAKNLVNETDLAQLPDGSWGVRRAGGKAEPFAKFEVIQGGLSPPFDKQAWADRGHLDFPDGFDVSGAAQIGKPAHS